MKKMPFPYKPEPGVHNRLKGMRPVKTPTLEQQRENTRRVIARAKARKRA